MNARLFGIACIFVGGLLVKFGVPLTAVAGGMLLAAIWNWKRGTLTRTSR